MSSVFVQAVTKIILKLRHFSDPTHTKFFIENSLRKFKYFCLSFCDVDYTSLFNHQWVPLLQTKFQTKFTKLVVYGQPNGLKS
jgi:hypothetical protein